MDVVLTGGSVLLCAPLCSSSRGEVCTAVATYLVLQRDGGPLERGDHLLTVMAPGGIELNKRRPTITGLSAFLCRRRTSVRIVQRTGIEICHKPIRGGVKVVGGRAMAASSAVLLVLPLREKLLPAVVVKDLSIDWGYHVKAKRAKRAKVEQCANRHRVSDSIVIEQEKLPCVAIVVF